MSQREAAAHWSSDKVWERWKKRKLPNRLCNGYASLRLTDETISDMEAVREYLIVIDDATDWNNNSMLIRMGMKLAKAWVELLKYQEEEKKQKGGVV